MGWEVEWGGEVCEVRAVVGEAMGRKAGVFAEVLEPLPTQVPPPTCPLSPSTTWEQGLQYGNGNGMNAMLTK